MLRNKLYQYGRNDLVLPVHLNFGQHIFSKICSYGDAVALVNVDNGQSLTYREFAQQVVNVALSLAKLGVSRGDAVAICSEKCPEFLPTLLGIMCCGATFVPLDVTGGKASMLHRVNIAKPSVVFCCPRGWQIHEETLRATSVHTFIVFGDQVKIIQLAPTKILALLKSSLLPAADVSSLERIISASTPADAAFVNSVKRKFPNLRDVYQLYGTSEAGCVCSEETATKGAKPGSVGQPSQGAIVKVVDLATGEALGPMQRGEICVKSPAITPGYLNEPLDLDPEGFLRTGDVGYYDEDGYFFIVARIKELIKFDSYHVAPAELELVLQQHPLVREAGVVAVPHEDYHEVPFAFVVLEKTASITEEELIAYVNTQVSHRMRLEGGLRFVDMLPRGVGDKLDRKALKLML